MDDGSSGSSEIKKSEAATEVFEENGTDTQSQEFSEELVISNSSAQIENNPPLKISMLNSIETNKALISKSYTEFKTTSTINLISKSYNDINQQYFKEEKTDEKSLYDYESVRKLMNDLEKSKNKNSDNELNESNNNNENLTGSDNNLIETILPVKDVEIKIEIEKDEKDETTDKARYDFLYNKNSKEMDDSEDESGSNNTSYQDLPSIRSKSPTKAEDLDRADNNKTQDSMGKLSPIEDESIETATEKEPTTKDYRLPNSSKPINLNTSIQSLTSQCTIDSLAKRVQKLVGPVDYSKNLNAKPESSYKSIALNESNDEHRHSLINYDSIYKELDSIQDTLRGQTSFNKHLEDLATVNAVEKYASSKFDKYLPGKENDLVDNKNNVAKYEQRFTDKKANQERSYTNNDSLSTLNSKYKSLEKYDYNNLNKSIQNYEESNYMFDEASKKLNDLKIDLAEIAKINPNRGINATSISKYSESLKPSAHDQITRNYLTTSVTRINSLATTLLDNPVVKTDKESSLVKKDYTYESPNFYKSDQSGKVDSSKAFKSKRSEHLTDTDTIESSHSDSDDAKGPEFPPDVYGSRINESRSFEEQQRNKHGIYDRRDSFLKNQNHSKSSYEKDSYKRDSDHYKQCNEQNENNEDLLDSEYLRTMDKKLKKLIKKNLNRDLKAEAKVKNGTTKQCYSTNPIAWEIPTEKYEVPADDQGAYYDETYVSDDSRNMSASFQSHPYLPLKDVPMHELVKKLQREFELEGVCKNLPADMNKLWLKMKAQIKAEEKEKTSKPQDINKLTSFIKNPVKTLIENTRDNIKPSKSETIHNKPPIHTSQNKPTKPHKSHADKNLKKSSENAYNNNPEPFNMDKYKHLKKEKLQEIIQKQKDQHDRRIKALEKLTRLEKLQAEKLKKILHMNKNDSITSLAYDSFFQNNTFSNNAIMNDTTLEVDAALEKDILNEEKNYYNSHNDKSDLNDTSEVSGLYIDDNSTIDETTSFLKNSPDIKKALFESDDSNATLNEESDVEVLNLNETNYKKPKGIMVIKEKPNYSAFDSEIEENESHDYLEYNRKQREVHTKKQMSNVQPFTGNTMKNYNVHKTKKPMAWTFNQADYVPEEKIIEKEPSYSHHVVPRYTNNNDHYSYGHITNNNNLKENKVIEPKKMSLQEAFELNRYDVISRSRQRQKEIQYRSDQRRQETEFEIERFAAYQKKNDFSQRYNPTKSTIASHYKPQCHVQPKSHSTETSGSHKSCYFEINVENFQHKRSMTTQEIKTQTKKNYSKLPEVKQKQLKERAEEIKRRNRIKSDIYKKTIQRRVLSRGPNFNLNFKALENSIQ